MLTTHELRKKFKNNFDLCNFSIAIARVAIQEGRSVTLQQILEAAEARAQEIERK
jgi:hypothetical protein